MFLREGISKEDISAFIGVRLYMGIDEFSFIDNYWNNNILLKKVMTKEYYYFIIFSLHFKEKEIK